MKTVRSYKMERKMVPKIVAERRAWHKFGMSKDDKAGPNPQTTVVAEEIWMSFVANKSEHEKGQEVRQPSLLSFSLQIALPSLILLFSVLQGVPRHWTPENLAKSQALYKHELDTWKFSKSLI